MATMAIIAAVPCSRASAKPCRQPVTQALQLHRLARRQQQRWVCKAGGDPSPTGGEQPQQPAAAPAEPAAPVREKAADPGLQKGQMTAIVTGAISIIFGILYLMLVQFMDSRGGELLPPPPEAFEYM